MYGDGACAREYDRRLALALHEANDAGMALYLDCALHEPRVGEATISPRVRAYAYLRALERCEETEASIFERLAFDAADEFGSRPLRAICEALVTHLRESRQTTSAGVAVSCTRLAVTVAGREVPVPDREFAVLALLAAKSRGLSSRALAEALWPEDDKGGKNAVQAHISRLRKRLGEASAIASTRDGYRLDAAARVDLWDWQRMLRDTPRGPLMPSLHRRFVLAYDALQHRICVEDSAFAPIERLLCEAERDFAVRLGADALVRSDWASLLRLGSAMVQVDACDELGSEYCIRAHLAVRDRSTALHEFRRVRDALRCDFNVEPAQSLHDLLTASS